MKSKHRWGGEGREGSKEHRGGEGKEKKRGKEKIKEKIRERYLQTRPTTSHPLLTCGFLSPGSFEAHFHFCSWTMLMPDTANVYLASSLIY